MDRLSAAPYTTQGPLFDRLSTRDLLRMREVSKTSAQQMDQYYRTEFGPQKIYGSFFSSLADITAFREQMAKNKAIIIGSTLVHALARTDASSKVLEVCLPANQVVSMGEKIAALGATYSPLPAMEYNGKVVSTAQHSVFHEAVSTEYRKIFPNIGDLAERYDDNCVAGLFVFKTSEKKEIHLLAASSEPVEVLLGGYSTLGMNLATANQVVSFYPTSSFIDKKPVHLMDATPAIRRLNADFEKYGWHPVNGLSGEDVLHPNHELSIKTRWFGDSHCWVIDHPPLPSDVSERDPYLSLKTCSWYLCCPSATTTRLVRNRMENENFKNAHIVTWETEKAIWAHPCFWFLEGELLCRHGTNNLSEIVDGDKNAPDLLDIDAHATSSAHSNDAERLSEVESGRSNTAEWKYIRGKSDCSHRRIRHISDLEPAVVEFMEGLYKKVNENHRKNHNLKMIRDDIIRIQKLYRSLSSSIEQPSGYAICIILQCIEDVRSTGYCDAVQFQLEFSLSPPNKKLHVTCSIIVPADKVNAIQSELFEITTWDQEEFKRAGVSVRLATLQGKD
ncbi:hypothetical protein VNI00_011315 [Paramarasmius palmivorus]|uniref:F-box domain-containing protein n=1 Tax=Paramarasmius palmivorus TaxID=297713 RepID=A0AAW0CFH2_9AGAR